MERTCDGEIQKRIDHSLRERTCMQMECPEGAIRIECKSPEDNGFLHNNWRIKK